MSVSSAIRPTYVMGATDRERQRLMSQAALVRPFTRRLFLDAGIAPGMRVLDLGCGVGDVSLLVADLVGATGAVVGVDRDPRSLEIARRRAEGTPQIAFVESDLMDLRSDRDFDAVVGRYILMHLPEPVTAIRLAARSVRPGGPVVFQDSDLSRVEPTVWPVSPLALRFAQALDRVAELSGIERRIGYRYRSFFLAAGLPEPELRMEATLGGGPDFPGYHVFAETVRSLLPVMERFGVADVAEFDIDTLADRLRDEIVANDAVMSFPPQVAAWARVGEIPMTAFGR